MNKQTLKTVGRKKNYHLVIVLVLYDSGKITNAKTRGKKFHEGID